MRKNTDVLSTYNIILISLLIFVQIGHAITLWTWLCFLFGQRISSSAGSIIHVDSIRGATLHQKVVVTEVENIWRARRARTYNGDVVAEPQRGPGASPRWGVRGRSPLKLKGFGKTTSKFVHKFSTFTTYTVTCELATDTVISLWCVSCNIAEPAAYWGSFSAKKQCEKFQIVREKVVVTVTTVTYKVAPMESVWFYVSYRVSLSTRWTFYRLQ